MTTAAVPWLAIITAAVAVYGAILSTYIAVMSRREKRRHIRVAISLGLPLYKLSAGEARVIVRASNPGDRPVTLTSAGIQLPDGNQLPLMPPAYDVSLPHELQEGKSCSAWIDARDLALALGENGYKGKIKVRGSWNDALGTGYLSATTQFDIEGWLKPR